MARALVSRHRNDNVWQRTKEMAKINGDGRRWYDVTSGIWRIESSIARRASKHGRTREYVRLSIAQKKIALEGGIVIDETGRYGGKRR